MLKMTKYCWGVWGSVFLVTHTQTWFLIAEGFNDLQGTCTRVSGSFVFSEETHPWKTKSRWNQKNIVDSRRFSRSREIGQGYLGNKKSRETSSPDKHAGLQFFLSWPWPFGCTMWRTRHRTTWTRHPKSWPFSVLSPCLKISPWR